MDKEEPRELELSLLALLDPPISDIPSEGLLALLPVKIIELRTIKLLNQIIFT